MAISDVKPVLIIGGSGVVGSQAARTLRRLQPSLPIVIGGRDVAKAEAVASELGNATAAAVDLDREDLGLASDASFSAIAIFLKDDSLNSVKYAQSQNAAYIDISSAVFEIGPEVALYIHKPDASAILMASNWLAGTSTLAALHFAKNFRSIDKITVSALLDEEDMGGPAAEADYVRQTSAAPNPLMYKDGKWIWATPDQTAGSFKSVDGTVLESQAFGNLDLLSLSAATDAKTILFEFALGMTASRRRGEAFSHEIIIEITGTKSDGTAGTGRYELVHPEGQAPMTALGVAVAVERLVGLAGGSKVPGGLYLPHVVVDPSYMVQRLKEFGTQINEA